MRIVLRPTNTYVNCLHHQFNRIIIITWLNRYHFQSVANRWTVWLRWRLPARYFHVCMSRSMFLSIRFPIALLSPIPIASTAFTIPRPFRRKRNGRKKRKKWKTVSWMLQLSVENIEEKDSKKKNFLENWCSANGTVLSFCSCPSLCLRILFFFQFQSFSIFSLLQLPLIITVAVLQKVREKYYLENLLLIHSAEITLDDDDL